MNAAAAAGIGSVALAFVCCLMAAAVVQAADITWSGATSSDWFLDTNWVGGVVPGGADTAIIDDTAQTVPSISGNATVMFLSFRGSVGFVTSGPDRAIVNGTGGCEVITGGYRVNVTFGTGGGSLACGPGGVIDPTTGGLALGAGSRLNLGTDGNTTVLPKVSGSGTFGLWGRPAGGTVYTGANTLASTVTVVSFGMTSPTANQTWDLSVGSSQCTLIVTTSEHLLSVITSTIVYELY